MSQVKSKKATRSATTVKAVKPNRASKKTRSPVTEEVAGAAMVVAEPAALSDELYVAQLFAATQALPQLADDAAESGAGVQVCIAVETSASMDASVPLAAADCMPAMQSDALCNDGVMHATPLETESTPIIKHAAEPVNEPPLISATPDATPVVVATGQESSMSLPDIETATADPVADVLALPAQCLMRDAVELRQQLLALVDCPRSITLDVSAVERVDAAAMQVLVAFARDRSGNRLPTEWLGCTAAFSQAVATLGLSDSLGLSVKEAA